MERQLLGGGIWQALLMRNHRNVRIDNAGGPSSCMTTHRLNEKLSDVMNWGKVSATIQGSTIQHPLLLAVIKS